MTETSIEFDPLLRDLVAWVARSPRTYADVMEAWRTSCPRLTIWEDAIEQGLVARRFEAGVGDIVRVTDKGRAYVGDTEAVH